MCCPLQTFFVTFASLGWESVEQKVWSLSLKNIVEEPDTVTTDMYDAIVSL